MPDSGLSIDTRPVSGEEMGKPNLKEYLRIGQAAALVGVSPATLRRWDRSGKLRAVKHPINSFRLYRRQDLDRFLSLLNPHQRKMGGSA